MPLSDSIRDFQNLVLSFHPAIAIETVEEERIQAFLQEAAKDMQMPLFEWTLTQGLVRSPGQIETPWSKWQECAPPGTNKPVAFDKTTDPLDVLKYIQQMDRKAIFLLKDFAKHLEDATVARQFREVAQLFSQTTSAIVLTGDPITLPQEIAHEAIYFDLKLPGQDELYQLLNEVTRSLRTRNRIRVELQEQDLQAVVQALGGMTLKQARRVIAYAALEDGKLDAADIPRVLQRKARVIHESGLLDYYPVENNTTELGGFAGLKHWLARVRVGFSQAAQTLNLQPPKGIMIVGMQGCGKSLAAKAIAREWRLPLLKLDASQLYDKYVGESEKNFRQAIRMAESMVPTVLWIDEIEKSFSTNNSDSDGGLSRRLFGSFLTWLQEKSEEVFVVATANTISQIPPELLRKGRFDEIFFVDLPECKERLEILKIHLLRRKQVPEGLDLDALVKAMEGFSGAEIEQVVIASLYRALYLQKPLDTALLLEAIKATIPLSVSRREDLQQLRAIAQERFVSVR